MHHKPPVTILLLTLAIAFSSCHHKNEPVYQAYFGGVTHKFAADQQMAVLSTFNQSSIIGVESGTGDTLTLVWGGSTTGSYPTSLATYIVLATGGKYYYSSNGGSCIINVTSLTSSWAGGNFTASLYNALNPADSINLTQGTFSLSYQMQ